MNNGVYFHFTEEITYLRLWATMDLKDKLDDAARMANRYGLMGALEELFRSTDVPLHIRYKIYINVPRHAALWGCESWAMTQCDKKTLEVFQHKAIRHIADWDQNEESERKTHQQ
jgi:hypothetical protein